MRQPVESLPLLSVEALSKAFGATSALSGVSLTIHRGEVHGLVGHNGSGKSTLIKILAGVHQPDAGRYTLGVGGSWKSFTRAEAISRRDISFMHQDAALAPSLSVLENFVIGRVRDGPPLRRVRWQHEHRRLVALLHEFGVNVDPRLPVAGLTGSQAAVVALVRALDALATAEEGVLVLDEPTATLERESVRVLFDAVRQVRRRGCGVLFVTHSVEEVFELCDRISILRDGLLVRSAPANELDERTVVREIVGRELARARAARKPTAAGPVVISARKLSGAHLRDLDLDIRAGEIVGVTGLVGMGQDELPALLYGSTRLRGGQITIGGDVHVPTPRRSVRAGVFYLAADRATTAGDLNASVSENLTLPYLSRYFRAGRIDRNREADDVSRMLREFDVRPSEPQILLGQLSGGNQQKALLGKWTQLPTRTRAVLLHEPTQGVDVGAREQILAWIRGMTATAVAILVVSSEYDDLAELCDRVVVVRHGRRVATLADSALTSNSLLATCLSGAPTRHERAPSKRSNDPERSRPWH